MHRTARLARLLLATCLVLTTWLSAADPGDAAQARALEPPRPLPGYRPDFATQRDEGPSNDCLWSSGAMLLDKWTNGDVIRTHQQLRRLSGDRKGGSDFDDLRRAYAKLGFKLTFSPDGGERITWSKLLRRLSQGAGAVVLGDYSELPRWYGRWDYGFWRLTKKEKAKADNHAMYIERYDRKRGRVWLMDPLGVGDWKGEWISVRALRRFVWSRGGALYVAVTPTAKAAPFSGVTLANPKLSTTATTLDAAWGLRAPRGWSFPGADVRATVSPADDPLLAAALSPRVTAVTRAQPVEAPAKPTASVSGKALRATVALPERPGAYLAAFRLTDRRFGRVVAEVRQVAVFLPGARHASLRLHVRKDAIEAGSALKVSVSIGNTGSLGWADDARQAGASGDNARARQTRLVAHWIRLDPVAAGDDAAAPGPIELGAVPLEPGELAEVRATLQVPEALGAWALVVDIVDDVDGSFAALGSAPAAQRFEVVTPRGIVPVE